MVAATFIQSSPVIVSRPAFVQSHVFVQQAPVFVQQRAVVVRNARVSGLVTPFGGFVRGPVRGVAVSPLGVGVRGQFGGRAVIGPGFFAFQR
jgi:hypothetical protein